MRVAVALPAYERGAAHRMELDAAIEALSAAIDVEGFAESTRLREGEAHEAFPVYHYLRMQQRHRERPFDAALYPLGRDYRPCEPSWLLARQFPCVVWVLDTVLHHMAVAGMSMRGRWDAHLDALRDAFGDRAARLGHMLAGWWMTPKFYRRFDPVPKLLHGQRRVIVASESIRRQWSGPPVAGIVPLPGLISPGPPLASPRQRLTLLAWNDSRPEPVLRGLGELLLRRPELAVRVFLPELVYEHRVVPAAARLGGLEAIVWRPTTDRAAMTRAVDDSSIVAFLRADLTSAEHAMLHRALAQGKLVLGLDCAELERYPASAVLRLGIGWELAESLSQTVDALLADELLARSVRERGIRYMQSQPGPEVVAAQLRDHLERTTGEPLTTVDVAAPARERVERLIAHCAGGSSAVTRRAVARELREALGERWFGRPES